MFEVWFWDVPKVFHQVEHAHDDGLRFSTTYGWLELPESGLPIPYSHLIELRHSVDQEVSQDAKVLEAARTAHRCELRRLLSMANEHTRDCNLFVNDDRLYHLLDRLVRYLDDSIERDEERAKREENENKKGDKVEKESHSDGASCDKSKSGLSSSASDRLEGIRSWDGDVLRMVEFKDGSASCEVWNSADRSWEEYPGSWADWLRGNQLSDDRLESMGLKPDGEPLEKPQPERVDEELT